MAAEKITIARIGSFNTDKQGNKLINKNGKPYTRVLIDTTDGRKMSGFGSQETSNWNEGMEVEVEVTESNGYLNFNLPKKEAVSEMAIKTAVDQMLQPIRMSLARIEEHLGTAPKPTIGNTNVPYPTDEGYNNPSPFDDRESPPLDDNF